MQSLPEEAIIVTPINAGPSCDANVPGLPFTEVPIETTEPVDDGVPKRAKWVDEVCEQIFVRCQRYMREGKLIESGVLPAPVIDRLRADGVVLKKEYGGTWAWEIVK